MTEILALDIATVTGWARGRVGMRPECGSVRFGEYKAPSAQCFGAALAWMEDAMKVAVPDIVIVELMLPPDAMRGATTRAVRDRLAGLHGIVRAVAGKYSVGEIVEATVGNVRNHFIGASNLQRKSAKAEVVAQCKRLGWNVKDDNAADAAALFSYACALVDPKGALQVTPLFGNPNLKVTVWP